MAPLGQSVRVDLESVADELYSLSPRDFIAVRNDLAAKAAKDGDETLALRIRRLRKPSTSAWLVNLLSRDHPEEMAALTELGTALRHAQQALAGETLRALSTQRRDLVETLVEQAGALGRQAGANVSDAVSRELEDTFTAALSDPAAARALTEGRLVGALRPEGGLGSAGTAGSTRQGVATVVDIRTRARKREPDLDRHARLRERARQEVERARVAETEAVDEVGAVTVTLDALARRAGELADRVEALRTELNEVEQELSRVERERRSARRLRQVAERGARQTRQRRTDAERRLAELDED